MTKTPPPMMLDASALGFMPSTPTANNNARRPTSAPTMRVVCTASWKFLTDPRNRMDSPDTSLMFQCHVKVTSACGGS